MTSIVTFTYYYDDWENFAAMYFSQQETCCCSRVGGCMANSAATPLGHTLAAPFGVRVVILPTARCMSFVPFDWSRAPIAIATFGCQPNPLAQERIKNIFHLICIDRIPKWQLAAVPLLGSYEMIGLERRAIETASSFVWLLYLAAALPFGWNFDQQTRRDQESVAIGN